MVNSFSCISRPNCCNLISGIGLCVAAVNIVRRWYSAYKSSVDRSFGALYFNCIILDSCVEAGN